VVAGVVLALRARRRSAPSVSVPSS
jgi:hypothetical protein